MTSVETARYKGMLDTLQQWDPMIDQIIVYSKFAVTYLLQQGGQNPGWQKANIEGPVYLVRRRNNAPRYQLLVKNQFSTNDLLDSVHADWELDIQKNYVFYKVEDPTKQIRGLWFHDDGERQKLEDALGKVLAEVRSRGPEVQNEPPPAARRPQSPPQQMQPKASPPEAGRQETVTITPSALRNALHSLADDDVFIKMVMRKLNLHQHQ
eukprot:TRINITY_DN15426_c0_g1_i5.p1 TRINITY_DN15426_c0_g1~~TRINITY_DN15426_c0_g1_i5.p1  ORF type:complete len:209 (-),score=46.00 TRINITY_DN15426_c0_g1_i5:114-740(-)